MFVFVALVFSLAISHSTALAAPDSTTVLARVGDETITVSEILRIAEGRGWYRKSPEQDAERLEKLLDDAIANVLIEKEARRLGAGEHPELQSHISQSAFLTAQKIFSEEYIRPRLRLDSAALDSFYHTYAQRYSTTRAQRRVRHITTAKPGRGVPKSYLKYRDPLYEDWDPKRKIDSLYARLERGEDFDSLARAHSEDPHSKGRGGDINWVSDYSLGEGPFAESCLTMPLHKISRPFESPNAWHIVQVTDERDSGLVEMNVQIALDIGNILAKDQSTAIRDAISDSIQEAGTIRFDGDAMGQPVDDWTNETVLAMVNGRDTIFAEDFLRDRLTMKDQTHPPETLGEIQDFIRHTYYPDACWKKLFRDWGYFDRPEIAEVRSSRRLGELKDKVLLEINSPPPIPDSATIRDYYEAHPGEFVHPAQTLDQAWNRIRNMIHREWRANERKKQIERIGRRYGLVRYPGRLAEVALPERP